MKRKNFSIRLTLVLVLSFSLISAVPVLAVELPVPLGSAANFAVLAGASISNTGATAITGDVGCYPTNTQTGFESVTITGTNHFANSVTQGGKTDLLTAYNDAAGRTPSTVAAELGGTTKNAGVYNSAAGTFGITGTLTLDAQNDTNAVFIFQMATTLTTATSSVVTLTNGAQASNVYWQVGSSATLGVNSTFRGTILADTSITVNSGATVDGRVLAINGAVTLDTNTITANTAESYDDSGHTTIDNDFGSGQSTVYIWAHGLDTSINYDVAYYDGGASGGQRQSTETNIAPTSPGNLSSSYILTTNPAATPGTWHAVVFRTGASVPTNYNDAAGTTGYVSSDSFAVQASAIPEFPAVIAAIGVSGLCFAIYYLMRKRRFSYA